jgi:hypothetical protein
MSNHFYMGAINKTTNEYEYATIADKHVFKSDRFFQKKYIYIVVDGNTKIS